VATTITTTTTTTTVAPQTTIDLNAAIRDRVNGNRCAKRLSIQQIGSVVFKCVRLNKQLVWQSQN
jgi:hypothetical protein